MITGIAIGSVYALIASGYALVYSLLDFSNWAHGEVCMLGAYGCFMAALIPNLPFAISALIGICGAAAVSFLNELAAYRRIRKNGSPNMFLMIAAMGLSTTYQNLANVIWGSKFKQLPACSGRTARILGIRIDRVIALVFLLAGSLAGLAGIMYGMKYNVYPTMGNVGLKAFIASVIGGLGSVPGAIIGALLLGFIETVVSGYISSGMRDLISFSLLILILLVRPAGLFGVDVQEKA